MLPNTQDSDQLLAYKAAKNLHLIASDIQSSVVAPSYNDSLNMLFVKITIYTAIIAG